MKVRTMLWSAALIGATALVTTQVVSQDHPDHPQEHPGDKQDQPGDKPEMDPRMAEMFEKMEAYGKTGPQHERLAQRAGRWLYEGQFWMIPDMAPMASSGTAEFKTIMGGRYLVQAVREREGAPMGPFEGMSIIGYDNFKQKHFSIWIDNMSTGAMLSQGDYDPSTHTVTLVGEGPDCMSGGMKRYRTTERHVSDDEFVVEMFSPGPDGKEFRTMTITYTRAE